MGLIRQQFFKSKTAQQAGRHPHGYLGGFNHHSTTAATRIVQRHDVIHALRLTCLHVPPGGSDHGGSQCFLEWRIALIGAPAALEQRLTRGVDVQRQMICAQVGMHPHIGPGGLDTGPLAVFVAKAVTQRILDTQSSKVQALQGRALGGDVHLEGLARCEPDFPRHFTCGVVQVVFVAIGPMPQLYQHTLRQTAVQVQAQGIAPTGRHGHTRAQGLRLGVRAQPGHFVGQQRFHAGGAGKKQVQLVHIGLSL